MFQIMDTDSKSNDKLLMISPKDPTLETRLGNFLKNRSIKPLPRKRVTDGHVSIDPPEVQKVDGFLFALFTPADAAVVAHWLRTAERLTQN